MANVLSLTNVTGSPVTVPATGAPATLITYQVGENNYQALEIKFTATLTTAAGSTAQSIIVEFKFGGVVFESISTTTRAAASDLPLHFNAMARLNGKGALTVTLRANGGSADANSSLTIQNTYILGHY